MNNLTCLIFTSNVPCAPSTDLVRQTIDSFRENVSECQILLHYDSGKQCNDKYLENLRNMVSRDYVNMSLHSSDYESLARSARYLIHNRVRTDYLVFLEHDWIFLEKIPIVQLMNIMDANQDIEYIRFNKRQTKRKKLDAWLETKQFGGIDLTATNGFSNNPHLARTHEYIYRYLHHYDYEKPFAFGTERPIHNYLAGEIERRGPEDVHDEWQMYIYGPKNYQATVKHIDGDRKAKK